MNPSVHIITGPTASGKSQKALEMATSLGGEIINGDSMQLYDGLPLLTACPSQEDCQQIPHHLYQILSPDFPGSAAWWVRKVTAVIQEVMGREKVPIIVGGTGLYFQALTQGLSPIPDIPDGDRLLARQEAQDLSIEDFYERVCVEDPQVRHYLPPADTHRLIRALEVMRATGRSLFEWQKEPRTPSNFSFERHVIMPDRDVLYARINQRFVTMIEQGAIEEVKRLLAYPVREGQIQSSIFRAVGVKEISAYLREEISLDKMIELGQQATRQYAKRQMTWLRTQKW